MKILMAVLFIIHGLIVAAQASGSFKPGAGIANPSWLSWWPTQLGQSWLLSRAGSLGTPAAVWGGVLYLMGGILLFVDPHLPEWLPEITLRHLQVGRAWVTVYFFRTSDGASDYQVVEQHGKLKVIRQASPWSLTSGVGERLKDFLDSFFCVILPKYSYLTAPTKIAIHSSDFKNLSQII